MLIGDDEVVSDIDPQIDWGSGVSGTVTAPDGAGLGDVTVTAYGKSSWGSWDRVSSARTNSSGAYVLSGLEAGTYRLGFSTGSGEYLREYWNDAATLAGASDITVGADALVSGKDAQLTAASHIAGTVTGPGGAGLSGVSVSAYRQVPGTAGWTMVDDVWARHGHRRHVRPGWSRCRHLPHRVLDLVDRTHRGRIWNDAASVETATDITVGPGATVASGTPSWQRGPHHRHHRSPVRTARGCRASV